VIYEVLRGRRREHDRRRVDEHVLFDPDGPIWNSFRSQELVPGRLFDQVFPDGHLIDEGSGQKLAEDFNLKKDGIRVNGDDRKPQDAGRHT